MSGGAAIERSAEVVESALDEFGMRASTIELLNSTNHFNAKITVDSGSYFLKILDSDCTETRLKSRFQFLDFLRERELHIPVSISTVGGERFSKLFMDGEERLAVLYDWIDGQTLGDATDEHSIGNRGALLARWHVQSQQFNPPHGFDVPSWDDVCAPTSNGWLRSFLDESPIDREGLEVIHVAAERTRSIASRLPMNRHNHGLIHADFHGDNLICDGHRIWIVDCDDLGWGYFLFDIAWPALMFAKHHPDAGSFLTPFLRGYERIRPLNDQEQELLPLFLLGAGMGALEMIHSSPIANDAPSARSVDRCDRCMAPTGIWTRQLESTDDNSNTSDQRRVTGGSLPSCCLMTPRSWTSAVRSKSFPSPAETRTHPHSMCSRWPRRWTPSSRATGCP